MRVEIELLDHPKFLRLRKRLGNDALEILLRIWGHCQSAQRGGTWRAADAEYVEIVARWSGNPGEAYKALVEVGFIDERANSIVIHDWEEFNSRTITNWRNGRSGGRPAGKKAEPHNNPPRTDGKPMGLPRVTRGEPERVSERVSERMNEGGDMGTPPEVVSETPSPASEAAPSPATSTPHSEAVSPTADEVIAFARAFTGEMAAGTPGPIPDEYAARWHAWRANSRNAGFDTILDWQRDLTFRWRTDWRKHGAQAPGDAATAEKGAPKTAETPWQLKQRLEALGALIAEHPGNPENGVGSLARKERERPAFDALRRERRELQARLAQAQPQEVTP